MPQMNFWLQTGKTSFADVDINIFMRGDEFTNLSELYFPDNLKNVTQFS